MTASSIADQRLRRRVKPKRRLTTNRTNATTNFTVSQELAALNIADGVVVTLGSPAPAAPEFAAFAGGRPEGAAPIQGVPEPGTAALLFGGLLTMLGVRRRR